MAFENFWKRDRERYGDDRNPERSRSMQGGREENRGRDPDRGYGLGSSGDYQRRGSREGSDYYGNRDERFGQGGYGQGGYGAERSRQQFSGQREYGGEQDYGSQSSSGEWRGEEESYGSGFGRSRYGRDFGDDESRGSFGTFGSGGHGRDMDYGRRGAYGYGGYGGMGGAESGSSAYGADQQFRGRGPRGYRRSDERIKEDVCDMLTEDPYIDASNIEVTVKDCEVTLSGNVNAREDKRRAEDLIERISGVKDVHNTLRVSAEQRGGSSSAEGQSTGTSSSQTSRH